MRKSELFQFRPFKPLYHGPVVNKSGFLSEEVNGGTSNHQLSDSCKIALQRWKLSPVLVQVTYLFETTWEDEIDIAASKTAIKLIYKSLYWADCTEKACITNTTQGKWIWIWCKGFIRISFC